MIVSPSDPLNNFPLCLAALGGQVSGECRTHSARADRVILGVRAQSSELKALAPQTAGGLVAARRGRALRADPSGQSPVTSRLSAPGAYGAIRGGSPTQFGPWITFLS